MVKIFAIVIMGTLTCASFSARPENFYDVKEKIALITGGSRGIGLAMTTELLINGAKGVTMIGINADRGKKAVEMLNARFNPGRVIFLTADVSDARQFGEAFNASIKHWGGLDIVINNAGIVNENNVTATVNINAVGVVHGTLLGMKHMSTGKGGRGGVVINVSSIYGIDPIFATPIYGGTKSFIVGFSRALGNQIYCDHNKVRVVTLCPGLTKTDLLSVESFLNGVSEEFKPGLKEISRQYLQNSFLQSPEYLGKAVIALIRSAISGSVWVSEDEHPPYEVEFPDRLSMKKSKNSFYRFD